MSKMRPNEEDVLAVDVETNEPGNLRSKSRTILLYVLAGTMVIALLILVLALYFGLNNGESQSSRDRQHKSACEAGTKFSNYSVSTDTSACSKIGCDVLHKGGSAVDATIATMFCITVVTMHSSGIGGGAFMFVYEKHRRKATFIDSRETAPGAATKNMYVKNLDNAKKGPLAAGIPGEVKGMIKAHAMYGKLKWADLVQPSIILANEGFTVTHALAAAIKRSIAAITDPDFRKLLSNKGGDLKKEGDKIVNKKLAVTLKEIQKDPNSFYTGKLAKKIAADFKNNGGIITEEDLKSYSVRVRSDILSLDLNNLTMLSCPPPSGGPVVTQILNILQNYKFNRTSIADVNNTILTYHRIIEAFKFAYAQRPYLGDPKFVNDTKMQQIVKSTMDVEFNKKLYKMIWDNSTHINASYYEGKNFLSDEGSTTHLSVLGPNGDAVSVTSTINYYFGGKFRSNVTGIIYNNEMDDFSTPNTTNGFGYPASENNFIAPGKRPLSSMSPTIFVDKKTGQTKLIIGAAGGSRIITATALVSMFHLWMGLPLNEAVKRPRIHHQLFPPNVVTEKIEGYRLAEEIIKGLESKGHTVKVGGLSIVQAISLDHEERSIFASSDPRKGGKAWGL